MTYQIIDSDDYAASGIEAFFFPGGEPHVKLPKFEGRFLLFLKLRTWNDVGLAACVLDALRRRGTRGDQYQVFIPYFPGARQDRSDGNTPLTANITLALLGCKRPVMFDPHSAFIEGCARQIFMPADLLPVLPEYAGIIAPDRGAVDRAEEMAHYLGIKNVLVAEKVREFSTGKILKYDLRMLYEPGERYLVVDDICDGGATFNILADSIPKDVRLDLWVSHGIFSRGVEAIRSRYERIFTTDSWYAHKGYHTSHDARVTVLPLAPLFDKIMES